MSDSMKPTALEKAANHLAALCHDPYSRLEDFDTAVETLRYAKFGQDDPAEWPEEVGVSPGELARLRRIEEFAKVMVKRLRGALGSKGGDE